ncbi:MAG TPA: hypothetical protein VKD89_07595 [Candidatus Udaeobacter sp.]|nr:hypothetical protein [Candidatus Udaeobacter sp.]
MSKNEQRPVETVEEFKLRFAAIIRAKPAQIPAPNQPRAAEAGDQPESKTANYNVNGLPRFKGSR